MLVRFVAVALMLCLPSIGWSQSVKMTAALSVEVKQLVGPIEVEIDGTLADFQLLRPAPTDAVVFQVVSPPGKFAFVFQANREGTYYLLVTAAKGGKFRNGFTVITTGGTPAPPPGPGPAPGPGPGPAPGPVPIPGGFRAVLVYESSSNMTKEQLNTLESPRIRDYLNRKCVDGPKGWRKWDKDVDTKYETDTFKALWAAIKPQVNQLPAVVVVTGAKGEWFPLPMTEVMTLELLEKYGGK